MTAVNKIYTKFCETDSFRLVTRSFLSLKQHSFFFFFFFSSSSYEQLDQWTMLPVTRSHWKTCSPLDLRYMRMSSINTETLQSELQLATLPPCPKRKEDSNRKKTSWQSEAIINYQQQQQKKRISFTHSILSLFPPNPSNGSSSSRKDQTLTAKLSDMYSFLTGYLEAIASKDIAVGLTAQSITTLNREFGKSHYFYKRFPMIRERKKRMKRRSNKRIHFTNVHLSSFS